MTDTQRELRRNIQTNLLRLMTREDLTQTDLAEKMNVSITTIHKWVHGQNIPRMDRIDELARILGATRSDILSDKTTSYYTDMHCMVCIYKKQTPSGACFWGSQSTTVPPWSIPFQLHDPRLPEIVNPCRCRAVNCA